MNCNEEFLPDGTIKPLLTIKQGETFRLTVQYTEDDGITPKSLVGVVLSSQIRNRKDTVVQTLNINIIDSVAGLYEISSPDTLTWEEGILFWDIREISGTPAVIRITNTERILVLKAQTRDLIS